MSKESIAVVKGERVPRIDGPLKVTGRAMYTSDYHFEKLAFAVPVCAKIGKGKIRKMDSNAASRMPGVLGVYHHGNIGPLYRPTSETGMNLKIDEARPPFEDEVIRYYGQYIAVVVAETYEIAQAASHLIQVDYESQTPNISPDLQQEDLKKTEAESGDVAKAFERAAFKIDQTYVTPHEVHNPIELHGTVANWEGSGADRKVTLYETSQAIGTHRNVLAQILGVPVENVQVISKFLGSGFGGKLWAWPHSALAATTARHLDRPVKLVIDRHMSFTNVGHRPRTQQRIQLSASATGHFQSLKHAYASQCSMLEEYKENCGEVSGYLYDIPNVLVTSGVARRNQSVPTSMRGPGSCAWSFCS